MKSCSYPGGYGVNAHCLDEGMNTRRFNGKDRQRNRTEPVFTAAALHAQWRRYGVNIEREPYRESFGLNFVALDPDGHRIRVCLP